MSNLSGNGRRGDGRKDLGRKAEQLACEHLLSQGFTIVERNWRCRTGEIDIIANKANLLIIVEVRSRSQQAAAFGSPAESITPRKIKQVRDTAAVYLHRTGQFAANIRFDVVAVTFGRGEELTLEHIPAAF
ncbi:MULTISPECIES: YraN family protein [Paenibacillus]|uniref:YraN family protein n=1 Tax=Paenibacillus TaxID=44249 RepID=UPI00073F792A|nr:MULTISPECIES: YraN family protein [Paenibacillus]MDU4698626.1 YraN family protein [Paenibacillus sp.]